MPSRAHSRWRFASRDYTAAVTPATRFVQLLAMVALATDLAGHAQAAAATPAAAPASAQASADATLADGEILEVDKKEQTVLVRARTDQEHRDRCHHRGFPAYRWQASGSPQGWR